MYTDPIADMLTRIRNASIAGKGDLVIPYSKLKENLGSLLASEGFVSSSVVAGETIKLLKVELKYASDGIPAISGIKRVSTPGQRIYAAVDKIPRTNGGFGVTVLSTSKGIMSDRQARKQRLGGEVLCQVW